MTRRHLVGCWLAAALMSAGCRDTLFVTVHDGEGGEGGGGDAARTEGGGGATNDVTAAAGAGAAPSESDSGTLAVAITVNTYSMPGTAADEAEVWLSVTIFEWETDAAVTDAIVTGGPVGHPFTLEYDVYSLATYYGSTTGYEQAWEFSIVRGDDHLTGLVLLGPSFHAISVSKADDSATIAWFPAGEPGVRTVACATSVPPAEPAEQCVDAHDEGTLVLAPVGSGDSVLVDRRTKDPVGIAGSGVVEVAVWSEVP